MKNPVKCPKCGYEFFPHLIKRDRVLDSLKKNPKRFNEIKKDVGISAPYLNEILQEYVTQGKIKRKQITKQKVMYSIVEES